MKKKIFPFIFPFILWILIAISSLPSCSLKKEKDDQPLVSESYILEKLQTIDDKFQTIKENSKLINCQLYKKGCLKVFRASLLKYEIFVVQMESRELASLESKRVQGLSYENWLFDNIQNEVPLIEKLKEAFEQKKSTTIGH